MVCILVGQPITDEYVQMVIVVRLKQMVSLRCKAFFQFPTDILYVWLLLLLLLHSLILNLRFLITSFFQIVEIKNVLQCLGLIDICAHNSF